MSGSECEENYSKHHHRKHRKRELSPDSYRKYKKRHKSHKERRSRERFDEQKRHKVKEESKECVRVKSEYKDRHERRQGDEETRGGESEQRDNRLQPSGRFVSKASKKESRGDRREKRRGEDAQDWGKGLDKTKPVKSKGEAEKPNFGLSGKLAEDTNIFNGVVIKYSEPPEARMPKKRWRLYPFKGDQGLPTLYIHRQSAYLLGRDRKVADIPIDHPSCSKQHAALQYRLVTYKRVDGSTGKQIRLYLIDLESANGTYINNNRIEPKKYVELFEKDVIKFGYSSREYVLLHEHSKDDNESENEA